MTYDQSKMTSFIVITSRPTISALRVGRRNIVNPAEMFWRRLAIIQVTTKIDYLWSDISIGISKAVMKRKSINGTSRIRSSTIHEN